MVCKMARTIAYGPESFDFNLLRLKILLSHVCVPMRLFVFIGFCIFELERLT